jgi:1-acyl-sn-glycerol-3-phosphate acyltransferase
MMEQAPYDPAERPDPAWPETPPGCWLDPGLFVRGLRSVAAVMLRGWLRAYDRLTIVGCQNLPTDRSFILVANHASHLDTLCLLAALPLGRLHRTFPVAASDYFCVNPLRAFLAKLVVNLMPFERRLVPWHSLRACADLLQRPGSVLIFFPEGTRSDGSEPGEFKPGVGLLAAGHNVPVVPCHLAGTHAALPKGTWWPRPGAVRLTIGTPRVFAHLPPNRESRTRICSELREAVRALGNPGVRSQESGVRGQALTPDP